MKALLVCAAFLATSLSAAPVQWRPLQTGVELAQIAPGPLYVVRIDPARTKIRAGLLSEKGGKSKTAGEWCRSERFAVAINAGMFQQDYRSNVGYLRHGRHLNNRRWNAYMAALAVGPKKALWLDLDRTKPDKTLAAFPLVVQNLRLISGARKNVWAKNDRKWSEAALAIDGKGRLLFLFSRAPHSMRDFNDWLLRLPLDIRGAMHLEGGPEASLSIHVRGLDLDLAGSNTAQWPIPNVIGVLRE